MRLGFVLVAGSNGAGKPTLYEARVTPSFACPFVNADLIQRDRLRDVSRRSSPFCRSGS